MKKLLFVLAVSLIGSSVYAQDKTQMEIDANNKQELYMALSDEEKERLEAERLMERSADKKHVESAKDEISLNWEAHPEADHYKVTIREVEETKESDFRSRSAGDVILTKEVEKNELQLPIKDVIKASDQFWTGEKTAQRIWCVYAYDKEGKLVCEDGCYRACTSLVSFTFRDKTSLEQNSVIDSESRKN
jgi:hypothetical protein